MQDYSPGSVAHQIDVAHLGVLVSVFPQHENYEECSNARLFNRLMVEHMRGVYIKRDQIELRALTRKEKRIAA